MKVAQLTDYELLKKEFAACSKLMRIAIQTNEASVCLFHRISLWIGKDEDKVVPVLN
jgi:hypothetical protein